MRLTDTGSRRWWVLAAALTVQICISAISLGFPALVPFVKADLHLSAAQAGLFATAPAVGSFVALSAVGWAVDRFGDKVVLFTGGVLTGLLTALASRAGSYTVLLALMAVLGAGSSTPTPAGSSAVMHEFPARQRGIMMSVRQTGIPLGGAAAAIALPTLAARFGWHTALVVAAATALASAFACLLFYRFADAAAPAPPAPHRKARGLEGLFWRDLAFTGASGIMLVVAQFCVLSFLVLYLHERWRIPVVEGSVLLAATQLVGAAARIGWGWVSDGVFAGSRKRALATVSLMSAGAAIVLAILPTSASIWEIAPVVLAVGAGALGWNGIYITLLAELSHPGFQGRSVAVGMTVNQVGIVLGPWLFGLLIDVTGSFQLSWVAVAAALVVGATIITRVREPQWAALAA